MKPVKNNCHMYHNNVQITVGKARKMVAGYLESTGFEKRHLSETKEMFFKEFAHGFGLVICVTAEGLSVKTVLSMQDKSVLSEEASQKWPDMNLKRAVSRLNNLISISKMELLKKLRHVGKD